MPSKQRTITSPGEEVLSIPSLKMGRSRTRRGHYILILMTIVKYVLCRRSGVAITGTTMKPGFVRRSGRCKCHNHSQMSALIMKTLHKFAGSTPYELIITNTLTDEMSALFFLTERTCIIKWLISCVECNCIMEPIPQIFPLLTKWAN